MVFDDSELDAFGFHDFGISFYPPPPDWTPPTPALPDIKKLNGAITDSKEPFVPDWLEALKWELDDYDWDLDMLMSEAERNSKPNT